MNLDLTSEQALLRDTTARFIEDVCPLPVVRSSASQPAGMPLRYLERGAELGWFSLLVAEEHGGGSVSEYGLLDASVVANVRGALVQPGPFVPMNVVAFALSRRGSPAQRAFVLPAVLAAEGVATWAQPDWRVDPNPGVRAVRTSAGFELTGVKPLVQDAAVAKWILLDAELDGKPAQFLVRTDAAGLTATALESFDLSARFDSVRLDAVSASLDDLVGTPATAGNDINAQLDVAVVLAMAETVGAMDRLLEITVQYAKDRVAFGRPIGSFQALKHLLADMSLALEMSKASVDLAAEAVATGDANASMFASIAKAFIGESSVDIAQGCFQVHGGIGFTWEHDLHLYLRRASLNHALYGSADWHRERMLVLGGVP